MEHSHHLIATLHHLLDYEVGKFTAAEVQLTHNLEAWINQAGSLQFKTILQKYLDFVKQHVQKLSRLMEEENIHSPEISDRIMKAFIEETNEKTDICTDAEVRDACLLASIQMINHYKISVYGTAAAFANEMNMEKSAAVFYEMEINEKHIDDRLSQLARHEINRKARTPIAIPGH